MPFDNLSSEFRIPSRADLVSDYKRSYQLRNPDADVGPDTQPDIDAKAHSDALMAMYAMVRLVAHGTNEGDMSGKQLDDRLSRLGLAARGGPVGASGYVEIDTSASGTNLVNGDELTEPNTRLRFKMSSASGHYDDDAHVAIVGIDTGPSTNLKAGTVLRWSSPRPGCGPAVTVVAQSNGSGLTGGHNEETDQQVRARISDARRNPAASGNTAQIQAFVRKTPDLQVEQVFVYAAPDGPGGCAFTFTLKPGAPGASRRPNTAQLSAALAYLIGQLPADDGHFAMVLSADPVDLALKVRWEKSTEGWADVVPWPAFYERSASSGPAAIEVITSTSPTEFILHTENSDYTGVVSPAVGQVIGFWNGASGAFVRKTISNVSGSGPWTITCETTNNASDLSYTPIVGQRAMPWSDSLEDLVAPVLAYMDTLGPGEMVPGFFDEGLRQRRDPESPAQWPSEISNLLISGEGKGEQRRDGLIDLTSVFSAKIVEGLETTTTVGTKAVQVYILELRYLDVFPLD